MGFIRHIHEATADIQWKVFTECGHLEQAIDTAKVSSDKLSKLDLTTWTRTAASASEIGEEILAERVAVLLTIYKTQAKSAELDIARGQLRAEEEQGPNASDAAMVRDLYHLTQHLEAMLASKAEGLTMLFEGELLEERPLDDYMKNPADICKRTIADANSILNSIRDSWCADLNKLAKALSTWCCPGWELYEETLPQQEGLCEQLLNNDNYANISPAVLKLEGIIAVFASLNRACKAHSMDGDLLKQARAAAKLGASTVAYSYGLYMIKTGLPKLSNETKHIAEAKKVKELITQKTGTHLSAVLAEAIDSVCAASDA